MSKSDWFGKEDALLTVLRCPGKEPWIPSDRSKVCSLHFKAEDYKQGLKSKRLKPDAVPSIFPSYPTYLQEQPKKGRRELKRPSPSSPAGGLDVDAKRKMNLYDLQEKQGAFKLVRCLTKKHLWPSNFEKMGVGRAVAIFSPQVTSVLRFLQQHGDHLGARGFEDCLPTVEFMEMVYKWFVLHNIQSTTLHWTSRDAMRMPFYGEDDERLVWLEKECLRYFESWKESSSYKLEFLSNETYEALRVTTMSTILCTRHLLSTGFKFVLTARFSSDDVESLFSSIRQLNGSNDQTDAYAALSALQKVLVTGIIHSSPSSNVGSVVGQLGLATVPPLAPTKATSETDIKKLLRPHLTMLERYPP
ncbi:hypothetical protein HPB52_014748 [Rhipicephalus sanguineus]|uniref:THAP-type domain-containing protein n=1 Tax=Rhipicephalus sanguineus TaxID=34632 RepID=A0A9D4SRJ7_RHISA|nr:hypothetical protein HPB52_014748 [Rhipicephalus sanguineus]